MKTKNKKLNAEVVAAMNDARDHARATASHYRASAAFYQKLVKAAMEAEDCYRVTAIAYLALAKAWHAAKKDPKAKARAKALTASVDSAARDCGFAADAVTSIMYKGAL